MGTWSNPTLNPRIQPTGGPIFCLQVVAFFLLVGTYSVQAKDSQDWTNWRGPMSSGYAAQRHIPAEFDSQKVTWRTELPGKGSSTPIVWKQRIYLTVPCQGMDSAISLDSAGKEVWRTTFGKEDPGKHANGSGSNASPVTDGDGVFVYFKSGTFAALNLDGTIRWQKDIVADYGKEQMFWDHGSSPVLTRDHVVLVRMHAGESWLAAFHKRDGKLAWKTDRTYETPVENDQCYTTPVVIDFQGQEAILVWGAEHVTLHSASSGDLLWWCSDFNPDGNRLWPVIASPVVIGDMVIVAFGRNDRGNPLLYGVRIAGTGNVTKSGHVWSRNDVGTFVPTPAVYKNQLIVLGDQGEVTALDVNSGEIAWQDRLPKNRNKFYASPLIIGDQLVAAREDGVVFVAEIGNESLELKAENDMAESIIGSPVPFEEGMLLRGEKHLFYVGSPN